MLGPTESSAVNVDIGNGCGSVCGLVMNVLRCPSTVVFRWHWSYYVYIVVLPLSGPYLSDPSVVLAVWRSN